MLIYSKSGSKIWKRWCCSNTQGAIEHQEKSDLKKWNHKKQYYIIYNYICIYLNARVKPKWEIRGIKYRFEARTAFNIRLFVDCINMFRILSRDYDVGEKSNYKIKVKGELNCENSINWRVLTVKTDIKLRRVPFVDWKFKN